MAYRKDRYQLARSHVSMVEILATQMSIDFVFPVRTIRSAG